MYLILQILTVLGVVVATFAIYYPLSKKGHKFIYSISEKQEWDNLISKKIGSWFTITNIIGTLTTLATVYVFFIGNTNLFGAVIFICVLTILFGSKITNYFTIKITSSDHFKKMQSGNPYYSSVIASIFWSENPTSSHCSSIVKYVSLINISSIIWLEFSIFSDISGNLIFNGNLLPSCIILLSISFLISLFTMKYGLRGFVFGDLLHSPLIALGTIILLIGTIILVSLKPEPLSFDIITKVLTPRLDLKSSIAFIIATIFLNSFLVLVSESHWLRVWIFGKKETTLQVKAQISTSIIWFLLILVGFGVSLLGINSIGNSAIAELLSKLKNLSPFFIVAFWLAGTAALFSTTDSQFYSFFIVKSFDSKSGQINTEKLNAIKPIILSGFISILFTAIYFLVKHFNLPLEKLVFLLLPICMNVVPAFFRQIFGLKPKPLYLYMSIILYLLISIKALTDQQNEFFYTLAAPIVPFIVSIFSIMFHRNEKLSHG